LVKKEWVFTETLMKFVEGGKVQEIFKKYKERLVNLSGRNRSLMMKKIYKKHSFDLYLLKNFQDKDIYAGGIIYEQF